MWIACRSSDRALLQSHLSFLLLANHPHPKERKHALTVGMHSLEGGGSWRLSSYRTAKKKMREKRDKRDKPPSGSYICLASRKTAGGELRNDAPASPR